MQENLGPSSAGLVTKLLTDLEAARGNPVERPTSPVNAQWFQISSLRVSQAGLPSAELTTLTAGVIGYWKGEPDPERSTFARRWIKELAELSGEAAAAVQPPCLPILGAKPAVSFAEIRDALNADGSARYSNEDLADFKEILERNSFQPQEIRELADLLTESIKRPNIGYHSTWVRRDMLQLAVDRLSPDQCELAAQSLPMLAGRSRISADEVVATIEDEVNSRRHYGNRDRHLALELIARTLPSDEQLLRLRDVCLDRALDTWGHRAGEYRQLAQALNLRLGSKAIEKLEGGFVKEPELEGLTEIARLRLHALRGDTPILGRVVPSNIPEQERTEAKALCRIGFLHASDELRARFWRDAIKVLNDPSIVAPKTEVAPGAAEIVSHPGDVRIKIFSDPAGRPIDQKRFFDSAKPEEMIASWLQATYGNHRQLQQMLLHLPKMAKEIQQGNYEGAALTQLRQLPESRMDFVYNFRRHRLEINIFLPSELARSDSSFPADVQKRFSDGVAAVSAHLGSLGFNPSRPEEKS